MSSGSKCLITHSLLPFAGNMLFLEGIVTSDLYHAVSVRLLIHLPLPYPKWLITNACEHMRPRLKIIQGIVIALRIKQSFRSHYQHNSPYLGSSRQAHLVSLYICLRIRFLMIVLLCATESFYQLFLLPGRLSTCYHTNCYFTPNFLCISRYFVTTWFFVF